MSTRDQNRRRILNMAGLTLLVMPLIGWIIAFCFDINLQVHWLGTSAWYKQISIGIAAGLVVAIIAQWLTERKFMQNVRGKYSNMIANLRLSISDIIFISLCAGIGEELLFRGAIQPLIVNWTNTFTGVVATAVLFVSIHGYINPKDWRITVYGLYMVGAITLLGYLTVHYGIWSAVVAHTVIDVYLLMKMEVSTLEVKQPINSLENGEIEE